MMRRGFFCGCSPDHVKAYTDSLLKSWVTLATVHGIDPKLMWGGIPMYPNRHNITALFGPDLRRMKKAKTQYDRACNQLEKRLNSNGFQLFDWKESNPNTATKHFQRLHDVVQDDEILRQQIFGQTRLVLQRKLTKLRPAGLIDIEQRIEQAVYYQFEELSTLLALPELMECQEVMLPLIHDWPALERLATRFPSLIPCRWNNNPS